ncbi:MAG: iron ABC transporter permease [Nitrospirota bacterium]
MATQETFALKERLLGLRLPRVETMIFLLMGLAIAFLVLWPLFWLFGTSFTADEGGLTLNNWKEAFKAPFLWEATWNTIYVSVVGSVIAVVVGIALALIVARTDTPGKEFFEFISILPFITPPIVSGLAWIILADKEGGLINIVFDKLGIDLTLNVLSMPGLIFSSVLYMIPFVFFLTVGVMRQINPELEEASTISGASRYRTFMRVTLPLLLPGITAGALLAFMYSNNLFGIHVVIGLPANIWLLTTAIYTSLSIVPVNFHQSAIQGLILLFLASLAMWGQGMVLGRKSYVTISGKGFRSKEVKLGKWRWLTFGICSLYIFLVAILPYLVIFLRSTKAFAFQPGMDFLDLFRHWDFSEYKKTIILEAPSQRALINSFWLSITAALFTMTLTGVAAYIITKTKFLGRKALGFTCMIPLTIPGVVLGVAMIFGYTVYPFMLYGTIWILLLAYIVKDLPLGLQSAQSSFLQIDKELEDSARVCGASWLHQFRTVTLPLVKPGMFVGLIVIFASMVREVGASIILFSLGNEVFAYIIFNTWEDGRWQQMCSFIIISSLLTLIFVGIIMKLTRVKFAELTKRSELSKRSLSGG